MEAIRQHSAACFYVGSANKTSWELGRLLLRKWDQIVEITETEKPPYIYRLAGGGEITRVTL